MKKRLLTFITGLLVIGNITIVNAQSNCFTETSQADFQADVSSNTDLITSPGDVLLNLVAVDQQNSTLGTSGVGITTTTWGGQTFTPAATGTLTGITVNLFCSGCTGTTPVLNVEIRATSGGLPTGSALATGTIAGFNAGLNANYSSTLATPVVLTGGTQYAMVVHPSVNPSPGTYALTRSGTATAGSDVYSGGTRVAGATSGTVWSIPLTGGVNTDAGFKTYMIFDNVAGNITSQTKDAGSSSTNWSTLSYTATTSTNQSVQFQLAGSNSAAGPFNFIGPDGTASTYYTTSGSSLSQFSNLQYLQYKAFLNTTDGTTPTLSDVVICYSSCTTPTLTITGNTTIQAGSSTTLTTSGATTYTWNTTSNDSFIVVNPTVSTTYTVIGANAGGCADTATVSVAVNSAALNFDGADDYIDIGSPLSDGASYTKEAWIYANASGSCNIISSNDAPFWLSGGNLSAAQGFEFGGVVIISDPAPFTLNAWTHVATTYDNVTGMLTLYKNGSMVAQSGSVPSYYNEGIHLGEYGGGNNFNGTMDEVRIWNRVLCQTEIQNSMNGELHMPQTGLVSYYTFNTGFSGSDNTGLTTLADSSGNSNNGMLTNFALNGTTSNWMAPGAVTTGSYAPTYVGPVITVMGDSVICSGANTTLTAGGVSTYTWSNNANSDTTTSVSITPSGTDTYTVTGTDVNGCKAFAVSTVTVNMLPNVTATINTSTICIGTPDTINAVGATTYTWSSNANSATTASTSVVPSISDTYTVTGTDANGCVATATVLVTVINLPNVMASINTATICAGALDTISVSGATTYIWSSNANSATTASTSITPSSSDTYTVTGTDTYGCVGVAMVSVTVNNLPNVMAGINKAAICMGASDTISASGATTYIWSSNANSAATASTSITPSSSDTYTVTGTDANGCVATATVSVTVNSLPTVIFNMNPNSFCTTDGLVNLSASPVGGTFSGTGVSTNPNMFGPSVAGAGTFTLNYSYTDGNSCVNNDTAVVNVQVCTGINNITTSNNVIIYPNPSAGMFTIATANFAENTTLVICNAIGQVVYAQQLTKETETINPMLANGVYTVKLQNNQGATTLHLVIQQ